MLLDKPGGEFFTGTLLIYPHISPNLTGNIFNHEGKTLLTVRSKNPKDGGTAQ